MIVCFSSATCLSIVACKCNYHVHIRPTSGHSTTAVCLQPQLECIKYIVVEGGISWTMSFLSYYAKSVNHVSVIRRWDSATMRRSIRYRWQRTNSTCLVLVPCAENVLQTEERLDVKPVWNISPEFVWDNCMMRLCVQVRAVESEIKCKIAYGSRGKIKLHVSNDKDSIYVRVRLYLWASSV